MEIKEKKPKEPKKRNYEQFADLKADVPFLPKKERKMQEK